MFVSDNPLDKPHPALSQLRNLAAVIWRRVQQLLRTAVILRIIAVIESDGTAMFASHQPNIQKEK